MTTPFTKDEIYELNEWLREKHGTYEDWLKQRKIDRREQEATPKTAPNDPGGKHDQWTS